jgi:hypothetical protein
LDHVRNVDLQLTSAMFSFGLQNCFDAASSIFHDELSSYSVEHLHRPAEEIACPRLSCLSRWAAIVKDAKPASREE